MILVKRTVSVLLSYPRRRVMSGEWGGLPPGKLERGGVSARKMHLLALKFDFFKRFKQIFTVAPLFLSN